MTLKQFIKNNRRAIDECIDRAIGKGVGRRNDEGLYLWAKGEGVRI